MGQKIQNEVEGGRDVIGLDRMERDIWGQDGMSVRLDDTGFCIINFLLNTEHTLICYHSQQAIWSSKS